ncbi:MAG: ATP-binding cassette domain-containing protein [Proteobacteria bacterium]|nr:ATP-binding cassette domain-containing protein [Pseudomonadota bacterium]NIS67955.1 ATP-binding cassette domain-containing protein [Pseudomonadota bacterium]
MDTIIKLVDVTKIYHEGNQSVVALDQVNVDVPRGQFLAIRGPSGCGKSTLINLLGGLDVPTRGKITVDQIDLGEMDDVQLTRFRRDRVGIIFQFFNLVPILDVRENVALPFLIKGTPIKEANERATELLQMVGLLERQHHHAQEISGGEMQRVAIARALINDPDIILADEPTGNLDSKTGRKILELLSRLKSELKKTIIMATHSTEVNEFADREMTMRDGRLYEKGEIAD